MVCESVNHAIKLGILLSDWWAGLNLYSGLMNWTIVGKSFIQETGSSFVNGFAMERIAPKVSFTMPILLLQKLSQK